LHIGDSAGYDPSPFGFYACQAIPNKLLKGVDIPEMENVFNELDFIDKQIQSVSGANSIETGEADPNDGRAEQTAQDSQILAANGHASCRGLKIIPYLIGGAMLPRCAMYFVAEQFLTECTKYPGGFKK
jgi:hypothetical protein